MTPESNLCPNCGRDWPAQYGRHNCNMHAAYLHNNSIVIEPGAQLVDSLALLSERLLREAMREAEAADLSGEPTQYPYYLRDIDAAIGALKDLRADMQRLASHAHQWDGSDYCLICGADGRA